MNSDNLKNKLNDERENLSADEQKICNLIGKLDKVDCPKDFDFHLKARIANANRNDFQPSVWQTLRYILPATAAVSIAAFVMIQAGMFSPASSQKGNEIVAANPNIQPFDSQSPTAPVLNPSNTNASEFSSNQIRITETNSVSNVEITSKNPSEKRSEVLPKISKEDESTMSRVLGVGQNRKPIYPVATNPDSKSLPAKGVFDVIGIDIEFIGGKIKVKNVRENSLAEGSGIKVGDLIESVDDVKTDEKNLILKSNGVKKITVLRDGKPLEIRLKTN